jgi:hypothetical protein
MTLALVSERDPMQVPAGDLVLDQTFERGEERREARAVALELRQRRDDRLDRRETVRGGLAPDAVCARRRRSQRDPRQRAEQRASGEHLSRRRPRSVDDDERPRRRVERGRGRIVAGIEKGDVTVRLARELAQPHVVVETDADVELGAFEAHVREPGRVHPHGTLARMLEDDDAGSDRDRREVVAPAERGRSSACDAAGRGGGGRAHGRTMR